MQKLTLLTAGAWALGLLAGVFAWLSPDWSLFPGPILALVVVAAALAVLVAGAIASTWPTIGARSSLAGTLAALAPIVGAALALILAVRGLLPHPALPLVFVILVGLGARRWARGRVETPMTWKGDLLSGLLLIASFFIVLPALLLAAGGQVLWAVATPSFSRTAERVRVTNVLVPHRYAPHAGITALTAGLALQAIANTGTTDRDEGMLEPPGSSPTPWIPPGGPFAEWSGDSVMRHALAGLTKDERAWLGQLGGHPALALFDTVAFAVALDPWAAVKSPFAPGMNAYSLPIPRMISVRRAARMQLYRAALAAADRKPAVADSLTREVISFGLRLRDDSDILIVTLIGAVIAREGGLTLAALWRGGGHASEADALVHGLQYSPAVTDPEPAERRLSPRQLRAQVIRAAVAPENGRSVRFEHLEILGVASCTDLRELLYGPTPAVLEAFTASAPLFQRTANETAAYALLTHGIISSSGGDGVAPLFRPAAFAFGRRPLGACAQVIAGTSMQ